MVATPGTARSSVTDFEARYAHGHRALARPSWPWQVTVTVVYCVRTMPTECDFKDNWDIMYDEFPA